MLHMVVVSVVETKYFASLLYESIEVKLRLGRANVLRSYIMVNLDIDRRNSRTASRAKSRRAHSTQPICPSTLPNAASAACSRLDNTSYR